MPKRRRRTTKARKNPARRRTIRSRAIGRAKSSILGLNIVSALKSIPLTQLGMLGAKWAAKRFNGGVHVDPESWQWDDYMKGALGAVAAGVVANLVKRGTGQKVLEGGVNMVVYYLIQNELITKSEWASNQFGQDDYYPAEYMGADAAYSPGDVEYNSAGQPYLMGEDGQWQALPESYGDELRPVDALGQLEPVSALGNIDDAYRKLLTSA